MESTYLFERNIISLCFNPIHDSVFILSHNTSQYLTISPSDNRLSLTEEDLSKNIIFRRFKLLKKSECLITNTSFRAKPASTCKGYTLYFWELTSKLIVVYPFCYLLIYDYESGNLLYHFQVHRKNAYMVRNIVASNLEKSLFFSAENMHNIYHLNYDNFQFKSALNYTKFVLPKDEIVYDVVLHPTEKFLFAGLSDGLIYIFNYSDISKTNNEVQIDLYDNREEKKDIKGIISLDVNNTGNFILSGSENGNIYLWDAFSAIKGKVNLFTKSHISFGGILSIKFLKLKQFFNLQRFITLTKEGKFFIYSIIVQEEKNNVEINNIINDKKNFVFNLLYENSSFNPIIYNISKYNILSTNFLNLSHHTNLISINWPNFRTEKITINNKTENYLIYLNFHTKFFYFYDNNFPKINLPLSTQFSKRKYEDYIPTKAQKPFENKIYFLDNFFVYLYEVNNNLTKKLFNFSKEFNLKNINPMKFEIKEIADKIIFCILFQNEYNKIFSIFIEYSLTTNSISKHIKFNDIIDFIILGKNVNYNFYNDFIYLISNDKQTGFVFSFSNWLRIQNYNIEASVLRVYQTPFTSGYCVLYRNILNELRFSENYKPPSLPNFNNEEINPYEDDNDEYNNENITNEKFKISDVNEIKLDYNEREIDVIFNEYENRTYCIISMIEKIIFLDENMHTISSFKIPLLNNLYLINSLYFIGNTLLYSKGNSLSYYYIKDNINQKIFTNCFNNFYISGILSDRFIIINNSFINSINNSKIYTPMLNPLEPILIGYLDNRNLDYNIVKECVINMFTNQVSEFFINKLNERDLKEVAWLFICDPKSSFQNIKIKINILNDMLKFDKILENILVNKNLNNEMELDDLIWKFNYDQSLDDIKKILNNEVKVLISYGQFDIVIKILEILGDYSKIINLLLICASKDDFEKIKALFLAKKCLSYTDNLYINNTFLNTKKTESYNKYDKIFDLYEGEHFIFGANQNKINIKSVQNIEDKIKKKTSHINNIQKKIINYGENPYTIYSEQFNVIDKKTDTFEICNLMLQKIEQYYGYLNTISNENIRRQSNIGFNDYNIPLTQINSVNVNNPNNVGLNISVMGGEDDNQDLDDNPDLNIEDIIENLFLSAYYHCDKGTGYEVEDISDNNNTAYIKYEEDNSINNDINSNNNNLIPKNFWTNVLDEFEPLEYEDKWGIKSPGAHSIIFNKVNKVSLTIPNGSSIQKHITKKFTFEFWLKLFSLNVTLLNIDYFNIEIENGKFIINLNKTNINGEIIKNYNLISNQFIHIAIMYKKKLNRIKIFLNCEEVINFNNINLDGLDRNKEIIFGNMNLDAEITEIKIWNQPMPILYLKENYKSPLPILAENKRKLRIKINENDNNNENKKKNFFGKNNFNFGNREKVVDFNNNIKDNIIDNNKGLYDFNPGGEFNNNNSEFENSVQYPSLNSVLDEKDAKIMQQEQFNFGKNFEFEMGGFDEINNQNFNFDNNMNNNNNINNQFNFQDNDFNFDS